MRKIIGIFIVTLLIANALPLVSGDNPFLLTTIIVPDDYPTIQEAINNANNGDTIFVRAGTYYENLIVDKLINLIGENKETTIIDGSENGHVVRLIVDYITITGFTIRNSGLIPSPGGEYGGITIESSHNNISGNIISDNFIGIHSLSSNNNIIHNNIFFNNGIYLYGYHPLNYIHDIQGNIVNGKPLYYYKNKNDFTIPSDAGQVILVRCNNVMISDLNINSTDYAIQLYECSDCTLQNSIIENSNWVGIGMWVSHFNTIQGNTLTSSKAYGIVPVSSTNNEFKNNIINGDTWIGIGFIGDCHYNDISGNTIDIESSHTILEHPSTGIWLRAYCSTNNIIDNTISNCHIGLWIQSSHWNIIEGNLIKDCHIISSQQSNTGIIDSIPADSEFGATPLTSRGAGVYLVDTGSNEFRFNTLKNNDIGVIMFRSWFDNIRLNNIQDSTTGIDFISLLSLGYYPLNYWGSSITGPIFKSNRFFMLVPWSPIRISEAP